MKLLVGLILVLLLLLKLRPFRQETTFKTDFSQDYATQNAIKTMQKLVHLDFKGAPPKLKYLKQLVPFFKQMGVTGLLIEYEDMFPYELELSRISNLNAYSKGDLNEFLSYVKSNDLTIIPLIQTYGHLEFILKLKDFKHLREVANHYQVITPCSKDTYDRVLFPLIDQIIDFHAQYGIEHIHIGCDEVYHIGKNQQCSSLGIQTTQEYFTRHVGRLVDHIKEKNPSLRVIIWDDMIRHNFNLKNLDKNTAEFLDKIDIMVWNYNAPIRISRRVFSNYSKIFKKIWISGAFKGATFQQALMPNITKHYMNTLHWMNIISEFNEILQFEGMVFTGWSRYDHMQAICELLPVGIPSLVYNLQTFINFNQVDKVSQLIKHDFVKCDFMMDVDAYDNFKNHKKNLAHEECVFPSSNLYEIILELKHLTMYFTQKHEIYSSILNDDSLKRGYINTITYDFCLNSFYPQLKIDFDRMAAKIRSRFMEYFMSDAVEELIQIHIKKYVRIIDEMLSKLNRYTLRDTLDVRP